MIAVAAVKQFDDELAPICASRLPGNSSPMISVVIPVFNKWNVTRRCLISLLQCDTEIALQVIIVDDASSDETPNMLANLPGIDVVRNGQNRGFVHSCNRGRAMATGQFLWFLNNDTELEPGAMRAMLRRMRSDSSIGIVGSKLVYPDDRLQEAGGIIWADAGGWNYGRLCKPDEARFNFMRDVDYVSGASLLVRAAVLAEVGDFDLHFAPAYYEDVDLCFRVREAGYRVVYEPRSVVVHYEGITSGTDTSIGVKRFQAVNHPKFFEKWATVLERDHMQPDSRLVARAARRRGPFQKTVLIVDSYVPLHDREAGSNRLHHLIRGFLKNGLRVVFFPDNLMAMQPYTAELEDLGVEVVYRTNHEPPYPDELFQAALDVADVVWICRPELCQKYLPRVREHVDIPIIYDTIDLHHLRMRRQAETEGRHDDQSWQAMQRIEFACAKAADAVVVVSEEEASILRYEHFASIEVVPTIHDMEANGTYGYDRSRGLVFIGGYNHLPNVDAAHWLVNEIMPMVWNELPDVRVTLLGSNPPTSVLQLASSAIDVPGFLPDVAPYFRAARLFVAPLRFGAGIKGKIGQALAFGLPIVTTPIGAEGFGLVHRTSALLAEDASSFARAIVEAYFDRNLWQTLSDASTSTLEPFTSRRVVNEAVRTIKELATLGGAS